MTAAIPAVGGALSLGVVVLFVALLLALALVVVFTGTLGYSVYRAVLGARRAAVRETLQDEFVERVFAPDPDWAQWVAGRSRSERAVIEALLDEYLRELDGQTVVNLQELGTVLEIPERSRRQLGSNDEYEHLYALTWLTLLDAADPVRAAGFSPTTPRERAAAARLRYESGDLEQPEEGIRLLVADAQTQFTVFGQDTLYQIASDEPAALLTVAADSYEEWSEPLLVQVLHICEHLGMSVTSEDLSWPTGLLEHEDPVVRRAAVDTLRNLGWRRGLREEPFIGRLVADPAASVRSAAYQLLGWWGDEQALETLVTSLADEKSARARLAGTNALAARRESLDQAVSGETQAAWRWSRELVAYDRLAQRGGRQVSEQ